MANNLDGPAKSIRLALACAIVLAHVNAAEAQQLRRQFAPGVLTTIPPSPQAEEMFTGPGPLVEVPIAIKDLQYEPQLAALSSTVFERSKATVMRRTIWNLEFSFKPMRMIQIDVPQSSGRMQRKLVWYMVYRVRNLGQHLQPKGLITPEKLAAEAGDPNNEVLELVNPTVPDSKDLYEKFKDYTDEVEVFGRKTTALRFFPHFVLRSTEYKKEYLDQVIPAALNPILEREFPGRPNQKLYNSLTISEVPIPISTEAEDHSVWGLATWTNVDPRIDYFMVYVQGLTNAYRFDDPEGAFKPDSVPASGRQFLRKTLQLNFWRPGDTVDPSEEELRYGSRLDPDPEIQQKILEIYGVRTPVDYTWVYR